MLVTTARKEKRICAAGNFLHGKMLEIWRMPDRAGTGFGSRHAAERKAVRLTRRWNPSKNTSSVSGRRWVPNQTRFTKWMTLFPAVNSMRTSPITGAGDRGGNQVSALFFGRDSGEQADPTSEALNMQCGDADCDNSGSRRPGLGVRGFGLAFGALVVLAAGCGASSTVSASPAAPSAARTAEPSSAGGLSFAASGIPTWERATAGPSIGHDAVGVTGKRTGRRVGSPRFRHDRPDGTRRLPHRADQRVSSIPGRR